MGKILGSWSGMRKCLEQDMLADSLKGRVRWNCTKYLNMDGASVFEVYVDDALVKRFSMETVAVAAGDALTNREILALTEAPKKLIVLGGGVIGLEMASYFNSIGTEVVVVEMMDRIGGPTDLDMTKILKAEYHVEYRKHDFRNHRQEDKERYARAVFTEHRGDGECCGDKRHRRNVLNSENADFPAPYISHFKVSRAE